MLLSSGNPIKWHEEVLSLQPMIPPKRFDIFPLDWGMLKRSRCVQIFLLNRGVHLVLSHGMDCGSCGCDPLKKSTLRIANVGCSRLYTARTHNHTATENLRCWTRGDA